MFILILNGFYNKINFTIIGFIIKLIAVRIMTLIGERTDINDRQQ